MPDAGATLSTEEDSDGAAGISGLVIFARYSLQDFEISPERGHRHGIGAAGIALAAFAMTGVEREWRCIKAIPDRAADAAAGLRE